MWRQSDWLIRAASGSIFLTIVCVVLPVILFKPVMASLAGLTNGLLG